MSHRRFSGSVYQGLGDCVLCADNGDKDNDMDDSELAA